MDDLAPTPLTAGEQGETGEPRVPYRLFALKDRDTFLVADAFGDVLGAADGLFHDDTRLLSRLRLLIGGKPPALLSASVSQDNVFFTSHSTNQTVQSLGGSSAPHGAIHIERKRFLWSERLYERLRFVNYSRDMVILPVILEYDADFHDMFEVRGSKRKARGRVLPAELNGRSVHFAYQGLDELRRDSVIAFSEPPGRLTPQRAEFMFMLTPDTHFDLYLEVGPVPDHPPTRERWRAAAARARLDMRGRRRR
ncbi:amylo-alpha-1,6-glucosidase, partial [Caulobacter sp. D4A]